MVEIYGWDILIIILASISMSYIITDGLIMKPFRVLFAKMGSVGKYFINCNQCTGFWSGIIISLCYNMITGIIITPVIIFYIVLFGITSSFLSMIVSLEE